MKLTYQTLQETCRRVLEKYGFDPGKAELIAEVFTETTFDGVYSHGINRFSRFIGDVRDGVVDPLAKPESKQSFHAFEQWDGQRGAGITNAVHCCDRAIHLARRYGIGCVGLRNTNHWMRGGTYGISAARRGYLFMGWTNTTPNMPPWKGEIPALGNNPFILAIPYRSGPVLLDMAMSLYAYGKLEWYGKNGQMLEEYGGYDPEGKLTRDPAEILRSGRILPAGFWKGSAMALVLDLAAAILSGGNTTGDIGKLERETALSQVFIAVDPGKYMTGEQLEALVEQTLAFTTGPNPEARFPGQRSARDRQANRTRGIEVPDAVWESILEL